MNQNLLNYLKNIQYIIKINKYNMIILYTNISIKYVKNKIIINYYINIYKILKIKIKNNNLI